MRIGLDGLKPVVSHPVLSTAHSPFNSAGLHFLPWLVVRVCSGLGHLVCVTLLKMR